jgi:hypothetical protein
MADARVWRQVKDEARESPVRFVDTPTIRRGSGGPQKPFSWLSEVFSPSILKLVS